MDNIHKRHFEKLDKVMHLFLYIKNPLKSSLKNACTLAFLPIVSNNMDTLGILKFPLFLFSLSKNHMVFVCVSETATRMLLLHIESETTDENTFSNRPQKTLTNFFLVELKKRVS